MVAAAAMCLVAALAAPTAGAAGSNSKASSSAKASKKSSAQKVKAAVSKKKIVQRVGAVNRKTKANRRNIKKLAGELSDAGAALRKLIADGDTSIDNKINGIVGVVTPILTQLGDGLVQLRDGSLALKAGLEELASKTIAGFDEVAAGFEQVETALTTVATSQEYGIVGVFAAPGGGATCCRLITAGSADIPDDGNPVSAGGTLPVRIGSGGLPQDSEVFIHAAIRSGEADGTGSGDEAGQVGGLMTVKCVSIGGCGSLPIGPSGADVPISSGDLVCAVGPTPNEYQYDPPGDTPPVPALGLVAVPEASDRTDQTQPAATTSAKTVNPLGDSNTSENDAGAAGTAEPGSNSTDKRCTLPNDGLYEVDVQVQFLDLPTSEDPAADD